MTAFRSPAPTSQFEGVTSEIRSLADASTRSREGPLAAHLAR